MVRGLPIEDERFEAFGALSFNATLVTNLIKSLCDSSSILNLTSRDAILSSLVYELFKSRNGCPIHADLVRN